MNISLGDLLREHEQEAFSRTDMARQTAKGMVASPLHVAAAERQLVGAAMVDPQKAIEASESILLRPEDFYSDHTRWVWEAILALMAKKRDVSALTVADELHHRGYLERLGGLAAIEDMADAAGVSALAMMASNIHLIVEKSKLRQVMKAAGEAVQRARVGDDPTEVVDELMGACASIQLGGNTQTADLLATTNAVLQSLPAFGGVVQGRSTGFVDIDKMVKPGPGDLIIIAARPSMGKTAFLLDVTRHISLEEGDGVAFFSLEMSAEQLTHRLIGAHSRVELNKKRFQDHESIKVTESAGIVGTAPLYIDETPSISIGEIKARARAMAKKNRIAMVAVDYIQLVSPTKMAQNRTTEISEISAGLKAIARELKCPVLALSQLNRSVEQRENKRPLMSDLRESGSIEQDADVVAFLYREEYYAKDRCPEHLKGTAEFIVSKNRNGPTGSATLKFTPQLPRFDSLVRDI